MHKIQFQKKETPLVLYDLIQLASAVHDYAPDMPLIRTYIDHSLDLIMAFQDSE